MSHAEWREAMLEADPAELAGRGKTALAAHVRDCARCRVLGRRLLEEQAALGGALGEIRPRGSATAAGPGSGPPRPSAIRRGAALLAPLAAAAVVAALWLARPGNRPLRREGVLAARGTDPARVSVDVSEGGAVVFATRDPAVTLVWIDRPKGERR